MKNNVPTDQFFASIEDPDMLASAMQDKIRIWRTWISSKGLTSIWQKKISNYYGNSQGGNSSQEVTRGGSEGELSMIKINDLHALIQEQLVTVTSNRPAGQARAINSDPQSLRDSRIGTSLAEYYMTEGGFEKKFVTATERALLCDEGFIDIFWDKDQGDPISRDPETRLPVMSGDIGMRVHSAWNVARDPGCPIEDQTWYIISYPADKFASAAKYPKFSDQILACKEDGNPQLAMNIFPDGSDMLWSHLLIADRGPALPDGRYALMIGDSIVFDDDKGLPYEEFPVERIAPSDVIDGSTGYASSNDIMAAEEVTDALHSVITSNQVNFGGQNIVGPEGGNLKVSDLAKGLRYFELPLNMVGALRSLDLLNTAPEIFNYIGLLGSKKEKATGSVSSALMAQATQGASGSSMALIQTQAISYNSGIQRSYFNLLSSSMTKAIGILRVYADTPRVAKIVGKNKSAGLKEFKYTGQNLNSISSITYELLNPMAQTFGGRLEFANNLLKSGQIKSPKQYILMATTGQLDTMTDDDFDDQLLIVEENEALLEGRPVEPVITENHEDHIRSHSSLVTQDAKENNPELVDRVLKHMLMHIQQWGQASVQNPGLLMATGQQPLMPAPPPMGMPGAPPNSPAMDGGGGTSQISQKADDVNLPNLPNIAGTNEKPTIPGVTIQ